MMWVDGNQIRGRIALDSLSETVADPNRLVWVDLVDPTTEDLHQVIGELGLPPTAVEDVLSLRERPKVVQHDQWVYVTSYAMDRISVSKDPVPGGYRLERSRISAIATPSALITIRLDTNWSMDQVQRRWETDPSIVARGAAGLLHTLLDTIVDGHFDVLQEIDDEAEELEDILLTDRPTDDEFILRVYALRRELSDLRRVVVPMRDIVLGVERRGDGVSNSSEMAPWWGDLYDHVLRASEWTESLRDMAAFLVETQMSLQDWRLNVVMKKLAGWAAIIAVPTLITGWFGQNIPFLGFDSPVGLAMSGALILASTAVLYWQFRRRDWL